MGFLGSIFTWWNGATLGTRLFSGRHGREVGRDELGNIYLQHKKDPRRRWVMYSGSNDASRVPPGWTSWLRGQIDDVPDKALPKARAFAKPAVPNLSGTSETYRPAGSLSRGGQRPAATGDYQAWTPE
ncbi:MAG: NADH:ubiquinone oxidoreductase 17.2 kD subunit [uncultured Sphingomonas sp.]|jgi:NADH:ubiquinone oxidoreductase subunit|uniref:NADH:ubiquinone oxidoreductase 17.2 kD subunit n=1 Tax=uncultured Sphingomonas sp. TaxID=158754 RepID=A0A6J4T2K2_9SPHN|nr:MAG: NADH:ubiquinone oxidoreductase 17.2 kD subunit [uncultured Sphingomonas sp.]